MSIGKAYPPETRERAKRLAADGLMPKQIAADLGVPLKTVRNWIPTTGAVRPRYDVTTRQRALDLHRDGVPPSVIARKLGAHPSTVTYWLKNIRPKAKKAHSPETVRRVLAHIDSGSTLKETARAFGVPEATIRNWMTLRDSEAMATRIYSGDRRARYAIHRPALALALSGAWR